MIATPTHIDTYKSLYISVDSTRICMLHAYADAIPRMCVAREAKASEITQRYPQPYAKWHRLIP